MNSRVKKLNIADILKSGKRTLSAEIIPPRNGTEADAAFAQVQILKEVPVDFISVTKGAGGSLRGGTLPIAQIIQDRFEVASLAHFTCRDYTVEEIENSLVDHNYVGVHNILALRGDPPDGKEEFFAPTPGRHSYAWQLAEQISRMNAGNYLLREGFDYKKGTKPTGDSKKGAATNFCIGVAAHPEHEPADQRIDYFAKKVEKGAHFAITQMIFSDEPYAKFIDACSKRGITLPILPGFRVVTDIKTANRMIKKFGCKIPADYLNALSKASTPEEGKKVGLDYTTKMCEGFLKAGAPGLHIFVMNDANTGAELLKRFI